MHSNAKYLLGTRNQFKAYINIDLPLKMAAIFLLTNLYLNQGFGSVYVIVNMI